MPTKTIRCCFNCVFACLDSEHAAQCVEAGLLNLPACANHPKSFGRMRRTPACGICPNYRPRPGKPEGDIHLIPLGDGHYAYVDAADYEWLSQWKWHTQGGYAVRYEKKKLIYMHRQIMDAPKGMVVDHINGNGLDNRRCNLRICTQLQNSQNSRRRRPGKSQFRGVFPRGDKWEAAVQHNGEQMYLGLFDDEVEAARARDRKAFELAGEFAYLNFPEEIEGK
jgi:hypothetical protein